MALKGTFWHLPLRSVVRLMSGFMWRLTLTACLYLPWTLVRSMITTTASYFREIERPRWPPRRARENVSLCRLTAGRPSRPTVDIQSDRRRCSPIESRRQIASFCRRRNRRRLGRAKIAMRDPVKRGAYHQCRRRPMSSCALCLCLWSAESNEKTNGPFTLQRLLVCRINSLPFQ